MGLVHNPKLWSCPPENYILSAKNYLLTALLSILLYKSRSRLFQSCDSSVGIESRLRVGLSGF
jgi:hypothetical protein